jgi:tetratricopeptide (TPR) repeat protein
MNKKFILLMVMALILSSGCAYSADSSKAESQALDTNTIYYPNANIKSAISKYKTGNYSGCLQELFSLTKKDPSNAVAYYYMGMAYTHVNRETEAIAAYEKAIALNPNSYIADYAEKGRDCLTGGPKCHPEEEQAEQQDDLDKFINAPYGNGLSPELNNEVKQKELNNIKETINKKEDLEHKDIEKIRDFDTKGNNKSSVETTEKIAMASDEEILQAVKTLKDAGLNITVQQDNPYSQISQYQDPRTAELSMLLGNNNNNNNNMMNMLPMLMSKAQNGENVDTRFMQAMMMNSMMSDLDFSGNNNNKY